MKSQAKDLTSDSVLKTILLFAVPLLFGTLFQQFYSIFDTVIVGHILGENALAGVGCTASLNFLVLGFCNGAAAGAAIPVAQCFGAKDEHGLRRYVANILYFGLGFVLLLTVVASLLCRSILGWMGTLPELFDYAYEYILVIFLGIPATFAYNALGGILRSLGDSKNPLLILVVAIAVNAGLDVLFLMVFRMSVAGTAWATVISQIVASLLCFIVMKTRYPVLRMKKGDWKFSWTRIRTLSLVGLPMGLQYSITGIGGIINVAAVNSLQSTSYVAAMAAATKIHGFLLVPLDALGSTSATFTGQNLGAKKFDRIREGAFTSMLIGVLYSFAVFVGVYFFGKNGAMLFLDSPSPETLFSSYQMLLVWVAFYPLVLAVNVFRFAIQGLGNSMVAVIAGVLEMIGRIIAAFGFVPIVGFLGAAFASPTAWILADLFLVPCFFYEWRKAKKRSEASVETKGKGEVS